MNWHYRIGAKKFKGETLYALFEYFEMECFPERGKGKDKHFYCDLCGKEMAYEEKRKCEPNWTEDSVIFNWYENKKELIDDLKQMLKDVKKDDSHFDYK